MRKIISLFVRDYDGDRKVRDEVTPGAEWVVSGEGIATRKHDGTCCMVRDGKLYKRYDAKLQLVPLERYAEALSKGAIAIEGQVYLAARPIPPFFLPAQDPDPITLHWPGWLPVDHSSHEDCWHTEAFMKHPYGHWPDGTYELIGPKIQGNPEGAKTHLLVLHGSEVIPDFPRTYTEIKAAFASTNWKGEGVVFHHPYGGMVKIKKRDFSFKKQEVDQTDFGASDDRPLGPDSSLYRQG